MNRVITLMPVRLAATRLPNKPLLNINGKTLVQRVYENVQKVMEGKSDIAIAAGDQAIVDECNKFGATAIRQACITTTTPCCVKSWKR